MRLFEISTRHGKFKLLTIDEPIVKQLDESIPEYQVSTEEGYKASVLDTHEALDILNIPSSKGISCTDPKCKSPLGHRVRELGKLFHSNLNIVEELKKQLTSCSAETFFTEASRILNNNKEH